MHDIVFITSQKTRFTFVFNNIAMKITGIELTNFKRFSHLKIDKIPSDAKLVLLIGSNGSGKSSVFDAFDLLSKGQFKGLPYNEVESYAYYRKDIKVSSIIRILFDNGTEISKHDWNSIKNPELARNFIGRSSIRIIPRISINADPNAINKDQDSPITYIENDNRFINDVYEYIQQINTAVREPIFQGKQADTLKIFNDFIDPLNSSLQNIFASGEKTAIKIAAFLDATPFTPAKLIFQKGNSKINYDLLSHGEKQVVILLLNFIVRKQYYNDSIIFIDEMDCHLNTSLQERLLNEIITKWIPEDSQLWTASHALGFISYANKARHAAILDFNLLDFDVKQEILPSEKENLDIFEIAVPKASLFNILEGKTIVVCENQNDEYFNLISIPNTVFGGVKDSRDVFLHVKNDTNYHSIRDRDFISDTEIERIKTKWPHHNILKYYDFENYIYHPDNIAEINPEGFNKDVYLAEIKRQKEEKYHYILPTIISSRQGYEEFKTEEKLRDKDVSNIVNDFRSDEFERFYKFFDMKDQFNKTYLSSFNLSKKKLVTTNWFKSKIIEILQ